MDDSNGSWDSDARFLRDSLREPSRLRTPRKAIPIDPRGSLRAAMERHGETCDCSYCQESPLTDAALDVLRGSGLL